MSAYLIYLAVVSLATFVIFAYDKAMSKRNGTRVMERRLLMLSLVGGAIGGIIAMRLFRHKTRHLKFVILLPLFALCHLVPLAVHIF